MRTMLLSYNMLKKDIVRYITIFINPLKGVLMKSIHEIRLRMAKAVQLLFLQNKVKVAALPKLAAASAKLDGMLVKIGEQIQEQQEQTDAAKQKRKATLAVITVALKVIAAAKAFAMDQRPELLAIFNYSKSKLLRLPDTIRPSILKLIHKNATVIVADLPDYGADAADLAELDMLIKAYEALIGKPKTDQGKKASATAGLDHSFVNFMVLMKQVDNLLETVKKTDQDFYVSYRSVRKVGYPKSNGKNGDDKAQNNLKGENDDNKREKDDRNEKEGGEPEEPKK